jgi:hypothetical protein
VLAFEIPIRSRIARIPYMQQLMVTEMRVVMIPWGVLLQPTVSINAEGHTMYIKSIGSVLLPIAKIPPTPYQIRIKIAVDMSSPTIPPRIADCRIVKRLSLRGPRFASQA